MKAFPFFQAVIVSAAVSQFLLLSAHAQSNTALVDLVTYPSSIVVNGNVITMDNKEILSRDPGTIVEAFVIRNGRIFATGSNDEMPEFAGPETRIIDVRGKTVLPGLIETHVHRESTMNAAADRQNALHAHLEQGCGLAELYPHHMQHCSHRNLLLNQPALDRTLEVWPGFTQAANDVTGLSDIGREGDRGIVGGVFQESSAWERTVFPPRMPRELTVRLMAEAMKLYTTAGVTVIASSVELGSSMTAVYDLLRSDKRLPVRWGYGFEMFRSPLLYPTNALMVVEFGAHHSTPKVNEWFWPMGITDGGVGDSRQVACFGSDLPGPELLKNRELCWDPDAYRIRNVLIPALKAGWRPFSLHSFGEAGVNVVGETEYSRPHPGIYFNAFDMFVNRNIRTADEPADAGQIVMPEEAVSRATALRLYTTRAAEWLFAEDPAGSLEKGKFANFTVLDRNYFEVPQDQILDNKIIMTVVGDEIVYQDSEWQPEISTGSMAAA